MALKRECHSKTAVQLKEFLQKPHEALMGFSSRLTELHAKLDADVLLILPSIADKMKQEGEKALV
jgi:hypothetical protein